MVEIAPGEAGAALGLFNMMRTHRRATGTAAIESFFPGREQFHSFIVDSHVSLLQSATRDRLAANRTGLGRAEAARRRNRTFTPRLERGRASNFAGDSAPTEKTAGSTHTPAGVPLGQPMRFRAKLTGS